MVKSKSYKFVCLNHIELSFARFCYQLFWFSYWQSLDYKFFLNINGLTDGKVVLLNKNKVGSLV